MCVCGRACGRVCVCVCGVCACACVSACVGACARASVCVCVCVGRGGGLFHDSVLHTLINFVTFLLFELLSKHSG